MQVTTQQVCPGACRSEEVGDCNAHSAELSMRQARRQVEVHNGEVEAITQRYDPPEQVQITWAPYHAALGRHAAWVDQDGRATAVVGRPMPPRLSKTLAAAAEPTSCRQVIFFGILGIGLHRVCKRPEPPTGLKQGPRRHQRYRQMWVVAIPSPTM